MIRYQLLTLLRYAALAAGLWAGWYFLIHTPTIAQPPGILIDHPPLQQSTSAKPWTWRHYTITPVAAYTIDARVLSTRRYHEDIGPYDFALGWQEMSDSRVLDQLDITQFARFYAYHWSDGPPADPSTIIRTSANTHLLPANDAVQEQLSHIRRGELIHLEGYLVNVLRDDGWHWNSSLSREDSGAGACEVLWVESVSTYPNPAHGALLPSR